MIVLDPITITDTTFVSSTVPENDYPAYSATAVYGPGERVISAHYVYQQLLGTARAATVSNGSPAVVTAVANGLAADAPVKLTTTGTLPSPLVAGTTYYWKIATADTGNLSATPGGANINTTTAGSGVHTLTSNSIGNAVSNATYWVLVGATNRWKMFDNINNTYTEQAESIEVVLTPLSVAQGLFLGGVEAASVRVQVMDGATSLYDVTLPMTRNTIGSSYYNWIFERIVRRDSEVLLDLPPVYDAQVKITISNPGATARCAMCALGATEELGFTQYGVARDIKDFSTEMFGVDGTSTTTLRGYSKGMSLDVKVDNADFDNLVSRLEQYRQRAVVWIADSGFKQTFVYGKYGSFKTVIEDIVYSRCSLTINGKI